MKIIDKIKTRWIYLDENSKGLIMFILPVATVYLLFVLAKYIITLI